MGGFKNLLKSDTPRSEFGGQGSHFHRDDNDQSTQQGNTLTSADPQTAGPQDTSASYAPASQAQGTTGLEAGGQEHVGTVSREGTQPTTASSAASQPTSSGYQTTDQPSATSTTHDYPPLGSSRDDHGSAAVGQTTTYSSQALPAGDSTGSVVDHQSRDPLTYMKPEAVSSSVERHGPTNTGSAGVTSAPLAAARAAFNSSQNDESQHEMPGEFPSSGHENPYKASRLDPRVDGGKRDDPVHTSSSNSRAGNTDVRTSGTDTGAAYNQPSTRDQRTDVAGASQPYDQSSTSRTTAGSGVGAAGAPESYGQPSGIRESTGPAPSTLTTTADPADRSAEYGQSTSTKGLDAADTFATPASTSANLGAPSATAGSPATNVPTHENQGMMSRVLGGLGLTSAAGSVGAAMGYGNKKDDLTNEPRDTSAIASTPGQISQETGPPKHYRRESIPTTAYPAGPNSARPIAPPVGGSQQFQDTQGSPSGRDTNIGSGVTSGMPDSSGNNQDRSLRDTAINERDRTAPQSSGSGLGTTATGLGQQNYGDTTGFSQNTSSRTSTTTHGQMTVHDQITKPTTSSERDTGREVSIGAGTAAITGAVAGAGAHGLHERSKHDDLRSAAGDDTYRTQPSNTSTDTPFSSQSAGTFSSHPSATHAAQPTNTYSNQPLGEYQGRTPTAPSTSESHTGRNTALGGTAAAAGAAGAYGLHERSKHDDLRPTAGDNAYSSQQPGAQYSGQPSGTTQDQRGYQGQTQTVPSMSESHTGRNTVLGGAAAAGAAGAHSLHERNRNDDLRSAAASDATYQSQPLTTHSGTSLPNRTRDTNPIDAVAAAPSRYSGQDAAAPHATTTSRYEEERDHTGRNAALGGAAGGAALGGVAAYASRERDEEAARKAAAEREKELAKEERHRQHEAEKQEKARQHELEKQEKARQHDLEKQEKARQHELEKQEKARQHDLEKQEKARQHELEKQEKARQHDLEKQEKARQHAEHERQKKLEKERQHAEHEKEKELERQHKADETERHAALVAQKKREEEEERKHREATTAVAGTGAAAAGVGAGAYAADRQSVEGHQHHRMDYDDPRQEKLSHQAHQDELERQKELSRSQKKPSIFKRIFKSRKNKDTGEDEDYSTDDEEDKARHYAAAGGAGRHSQETSEHSSHVPTHHSDAKGRNVLGSAPRSSTDNEPREGITGLPYDPSKDPEAARRLSREPGYGSTSAGRGTDSAPIGGSGATTSTAAGLGASQYPDASGSRNEPGYGSTTGHHRETISHGDSAGARFSQPHPIGAGAPGPTNEAGYSKNHPTGVYPTGQYGMGHTGTEGTHTGTGHGTGTGTGLGSDTTTGYHIPSSAAEPMGEITDHRR